MARSSLLRRRHLTAPAPAPTTSQPDPPTTPEPSQRMRSLLDQLGQVEQGLQEPLAKQQKKNPP